MPPNTATNKQFKKRRSAHFRVQQQQNVFFAFPIGFTIGFPIVFPIGFTIGVASFSSSSSSSPASFTK
jgi:ABC-type uncharacterized transport system permease subunit